MRDRLGVVLLWIYFFLCISSDCGASSSTNVATPGKGDKAGQMVAVDSPYCDAYAPYTYDGNDKRAVTPLLSPLKYNFDPALRNDKTELGRFLDLKLTTGSPVTKLGAFSDPGYPILGDPSRHLYSDGTDVQRALVRLFATDSAGKPLTTPLCQDPRTKVSMDQAAASNNNAQVRSSYYLIHIVRWIRTGGAYQDAESSWYVFNRNDSKAAHRQVPFTFHPYTSGDLRIFGNSSVFFLAIHLAPTGTVSSGSIQPGTATDDYIAFRNSVKISYKLAVSKVEPANIQDLKALLGVIVKLAPQGNAAPSASTDQIAEYAAFVNNSAQRTYAGVYGASVLIGLDHLPVQINATMTAKLPPIDKTAADLTEYEDHTESQLVPSVAKQQASSPKAPTGTSSQAQQQQSSTSAPVQAPQQQGTGKGNSSPLVGCTNSAGASCTESAVIQNEGLYWWDFSVGIPFKGYKELQYSSGSIAPTTISKGSAIGFLVLAPWKEDIVTPPSLGIPHFLLGLPLQGKVFNAPVFAAGETMNIASIPKVGPAIAKLYPVGLRFYCGIVYNKQFGAPVAGVSPTPSHRVAKLQYGIEFSARSIASKLSAATSPKKSSTSTAKVSTP